MVVLELYNKLIRLKSLLQRNRIDFSPHAVAKAWRALYILPLWFATIGCRLLFTDLYNLFIAHANIFRYSGVVLFCFTHSWFIRSLYPLAVTMFLNPGFQVAQLCRESFSNFDRDFWSLSELSELFPLLPNT